MMNRSFSRYKKASLVKGFTLTELLVVILIITLLMTMGAVGIRSLTNGKSTSAAIANAEAIFAEARATAIGKGTHTRVMIDVRDNKETKDYLKKMVIATYVNELDATSAKTSWEVTSRGYTLPDGVYFSQELSAEGTGSSAPIREGDNFNGNWIVYQFNAQGLAVEPDNIVESVKARPGATFVLGAGIRQVGSKFARVDGKAKKDFAGFTIWGNGQTSVFRDPQKILEQMSKAGGITEF
jgi:prepilin-type N-terminal cleavage/methylation domain-containing protein